LDVSLDVNVVLDICALREPGASLAASAVEKCVLCGGRVWLYSGSVQTYDYNLRREPKRVYAEKGATLSNARCARLSKALLAELAKDKHWLASLAGEGDVFGTDDPEDEQLARSLERFQPNAIRLLTRDGLLLEKCPRAVTPEQYLEMDLPPKPLEFIDLKTQQDGIRPGLERRLHRVLHHGQYIMGPEVAELEKRLADFAGVEHAVTCASGTDALLIAFMALDVGPGDEVITVPYTWISTAEVVALLGAKPVFADILPDTFNMDPDLVEAAITPRTKAVLPVSLYGQCADMARINSVAERHGIPVVEDGAQSFGATHRGKKSCGLSAVGCTSFFPSKPLGCYGDGGALFTDDEALAEKMRRIRVHGRKVKHRHPLVGINGRLDTVQAAVLLEKLEIFPGECRLRREIGERYDALLADVPGIRTPVIAEGNESVYAQYTVLCDDRDGLSKALKDAGVPSAAYYAVPLHLQGAFKNLGHAPGDFPVSEKVAAECLSLPMSPCLSEGEQDRVAAVVKNVFNGKRQR